MFHEVLNTVVLQNFGLTVPLERRFHARLITRNSVVVSSVAIKRVDCTLQEISAVSCMHSDVNSDQIFLFFLLTN